MFDLDPTVPSYEAKRKLHHTKSIIPISQIINFADPVPSRPPLLQCHPQVHLHKLVHRSDVNPLIALAIKKFSSLIRPVVAGALTRMFRSWSLSPATNVLFLYILL